ncbi:MAG: J domain-containing protein [Pseudolabrys sp.]
MALDLARMPALARSAVAPAIPPNVIELMRIAAESPKACEDAVAATGEPVEALVEASRFYLQHVLFRPDADSYRILGLQPDASRATARNHMRWLLQWLHPDRNSGLEAIYAERVLKAWRQISGSVATGAPNGSGPATRRLSGHAAIRIPWIKIPLPRRRKRFGWAFAVWVVPAGLVVAFAVLCSTIYFFGPEQTAAMIGMP